MKLPLTHRQYPLSTSDSHRFGQRTRGYGPWMRTPIHRSCIPGDLRRHHHVVGSLPLAKASKMRDLLVAPRAENAYTLKQLLIGHLTPSEPQ
ncbi:hypothetical protein MRX96_020384 [Rhipicephalus microplus]